MKHPAWFHLFGVAVALAGPVALRAAGPGTLYFNNRVTPAGLDAPVFDVDCQTPLGEGFVAQLYVGASPDTLAPVGVPVPFRTRDGQGTGYVSSGNPVNLPFPAGSRVWVELRAWQPAPCPEGESCPPLKQGRSRPFLVEAGGDTGNGPPRLPADLVGLESFCLQEVPQPPRVRITPDSLAIYPGGSATFIAVATGTPPLSYQWRRNGADLPGATGPTLTLPAAGPDDLGEYTVAVANSLGSALSAPATLRWVAPPISPAVLFANHAPGIEAPVYDTDCRTPVQGTNFVAQLWLGPTADALQPLGAPQEFGSPGFFAPTWLEVPDLAPGGTLLAQVRVWDAAGAGSFADAVARGLKHGVSEVFPVQPALGTPTAPPPPLAGLQSFCLVQVPQVVRGPESVTLYPGEPLRLEVEVVSEQPVTYQWFRNGEVLAGETNAVFAVPAVGLEHVGAYTVRVANATGAVQTGPAVVSLTTTPPGGWVTFANFWLPGPDLPAGLDAPVFDVDGRTRLDGRFRAQLYAGPTPEQLAPVGMPRPFGDGAAAGYWEASPEWREVNLPSVPPGQTAWMQVRVWRAGAGPSFEAAAAAGTPVGVSEVLALTAGEKGLAGRHAPLLTGLQSFRLGFPPRITAQPVSGVVHAAAAAALEVVVESSEPVAFQWWHEGMPVPGATTARLAWDQVRQADAGHYHVTLTSRWGVMRSAGAWLDVRDQRLGTVNFANRVLFIGLDAPVFDTEAITRLSGTNFLAQLWGGPDADHLEPAGPPAVFPDLPGPTAGYWVTPDRVRHVPGVPAGAVATVQVRVWDAGRGDTFEAARAAGARYGLSAPFTVSTGGAGSPPGLPADLAGLTSFALQPALEILEPPASGVFLAGEQTTLRVRARGDGPLAYQWQRNGEDLPGATNAWLELTALEPDDTGLYQVRVSDRGRQLTSPAALVTVASWPWGASLWVSNLDPDHGVDARVLGPDGTTPLAGPNYVAQIWAGPSPDTLQPVSVPLPLGTGARAGYWDPARQPAVVIPGLAPGQTAYVEVRVWDILLADTFAQAEALDLPRARSETLAVPTGGPGAPQPAPAPLTGLAAFNLQQRPALAHWPTELEVVLNRPFSIEVMVQNPAGVTYQWFRNGEPIPGANGPRLELGRVTVADSGDYAVRVANRVGAITTEPARLTVIAPTGGGTVWFANHGVPIFEADGTTPLSGLRYRAGLWVGPAPDALAPTGTSSSFLSGASAGIFAGDLRFLPNVPPDTEIWVQVRAWDSYFGATYEQAAAIGRAGQSEPFTVITGGYGAPPGQLTGLKSFRLVAAEPPRILQQPPEFYWVIESTPISFPVVATNYLTVYWERRTPEGWVVVPDATGSLLSFDSATPADAGDYRSVLVGPNHVVYSATATLEVGRVMRAGNGTRGAFTLRVAAEAGPEFDLEGSTNLADWSVLLRLTHTGPTLDLAESPEARQWTNRFYRLRSVRTGRVSSDIAGFIEVELLPGFSMVGLPLIPPSPRLADLLAGLPVDTLVYKYYPDGRGFTINTLWDDGWSTPDEELLPGEACLIGNPTSDVYRLTWQGTVPTGELVRELPAGWSLQALPLPWIGRLDSDLACPVQPLEILARWDAWPAELRFVVRAEDQWLDGTTFQPAPPPVIAPGEGFWIWKHAPEEWRLVFEPEP